MIIANVMITMPIHMRIDEPTLPGMYSQNMSIIGNNIIIMNIIIIPLELFFFFLISYIRVSPQTGQYVRYVGVGYSTGSSLRPKNSTSFGVASNMV